MTWRDGRVARKLTKPPARRRADKSLVRQSGLQEEQLSFVLRELQEHRQGQATPPRRPAQEHL